MLRVFFFSELVLLRGKIAKLVASSAIYNSGIPNIIAKRFLRVIGYGKMR